MIKSTPTTKAMNKAQAKAVTERIRKDIDSAWANITLAYEGKAWKALGYERWEDYVRKEFDMSRRRSYQLLDQGRVISAIADVTGGDVQHVAQISARDVSAVKDKIPELQEEIQSRISSGQEPSAATRKAVDAAARADKERKREERKAKQAENDRQREAARAALPDSIKKAETFKANGAVAGKSAGKKSDVLPDAKWLESFDAAKDRIVELEESVRTLELQVVRLEFENKKFGEMKAEWENGGFEEVIRGKDEVIRAQASRIESESGEKVRNLNSAEWWKKKAIEHGYSRNEVIDLEVVNG